MKLNLRRTTIRPVSPSDMALVPSGIEVPSQRLACEPPTSAIPVQRQPPRGFDYENHGDE